MALVVRINEAFTDNTLPTLPMVDALESNGSLLLIDAKRSIASAQNGAPFVNLLNKPNIVNVPSLVLAVTAPATDFTASITTKGGLQFTPVSYKSKAQQGGAVQMLNAALLNYVKSAGHKIYISWWGRCTRAYASSDPTLLDAQSQKSISYIAIGRSVAVADRFLFSYITPSSTAQTVGMYAETGISTNVYTEGSPNKVGGIRTICSFVPSSLMDTVSFAADKMNVFCAGGVGAFNLNTLQQSGIPDIVSMPAITFYRFYVEDLALSGRTYEQVKALDDALYNTEVLTPGGKYYGDS